MRKISISLATLLAALFFHTAVHSQINIDLGARGGFSLNGVSINGNVDTSSTTTLFSGSVDFALEIGLGKRFAIQPEIGFTKKGYRLGQDEVLLGENFYSEKLSYRTIPILLKYAFQVEERGKISLLVGPSFNTLTRAVEEINLFGVEETIDHDLSQETDYRLSTIGFIVGIGTKAHFEKIPGSFLADLRFVGATAPYKEVAAEPEDLSFSNYSFNVSIGYMIPLFDSSK